MDGHDVKALYDAFESAPFEKGKPSMIVAKTKKGKGISFMEDNVEYHHWHPGEKEAKQALGEMEEAEKGGSNELRIREKHLGKRCLNWAEKMKK